MAASDRETARAARAAHEAGASSSSRFGPVRRPRKRLRMVALTGVGAERALDVEPDAEPARRYSDRMRVGDVALRMLWRSPPRRASIRITSPRALSGWSICRVGGVDSAASAAGKPERIAICDRSIRMVVVRPSNEGAALDRTLPSERCRLRGGKGWLPGLGSNQRHFD